MNNKQPFKKNDEVVLLSVINDNTNSEKYDKSFISTPAKMIKGVVKWADSDGELCILWENSDKNYNYWAYRCEISLYADYVKKFKKAKLKINIKSLDKLILPIEEKEEMLSVLKQHENKIKLFEEWGIGEIFTYGKGMILLFYGAPGTGKTWGANCISEIIGKELLTISSADIQTSEPGGACRNIQKVFKTAKEEDKILLFDECDSLITVRSDVGMILASEINTLLTEIENFEDIIILTTNRADTLDPALERRISLILEFKEPDNEARQEIWAKLLPKKMPLTQDVKISKLAEYKLTGGDIKNAILQGARFAIANNSKKVNLKHFTSAIDRIHKSKNLLGTSSRYKQVKQFDDVMSGISQNDQLKTKDKDYADKTKTHKIKEFARSIFRK